MARRKKLNKRIVVFLAIGGVVIAVGAIAFVIRKLPKDPEALAQRARQAEAEEKYQEAERAWAGATGAEERPQYYYEWAKLELKIAEQPNTPEAKQRQKIGTALGLLQRAMRRDPSYVDAQRMLVELYQRWGGQNFITEADKLLKLVPDDHQTYFMRALAEARLARNVPDLYNEPAIADFRKAIELKADEPGYWLGLTSFLRHISRHEEAAEAFEEALASNPDSPALRLQYAGHLARRDRQDEARQQIQQAIDRAPDSAAGHLVLAALYLQEGDPDKAFETLQAAKKADASDYRIYYRIADLHKRRKQSDKAAEAYREGLTAITGRLTQEDQQAELGESGRRGLETARMELRYQLANCLLDIITQFPERKDELLPEIKSVLAQLDETYKETPARAKIAGRVALLEGERQQAIELLEQADKSFQDNDIQVANILINLYLKDAPGKAEAIIDRLLKQSRLQRSPSLLVAKASLEMRYNNYLAAKELVDRALGFDPDHVGGKALRAQLRLLTGEVNKLPEGAVLSTTIVKGALDRALVLWLDNQHSQAIELVADLHKRMPTNLFILQRLCNLYIADGQIEKCKAVLAEAQASLPDNEVVKAQQKLMAESDPDKRLEMRLAMAEANTDPLARALARALIYAQIGKTAEYHQQLQEAAKIDPSSPMVVQGLFRYALTQKDWAAAEQAAKKAVELNLDGLEGRVFMAQLAVSRQDYDTAIKMLKDALEDHPDAKVVQISLGECYLMSGDYAKAAEQLQVVVTADPSSTPALIGMAKAAAGLGKTAEHVEWIQKAYRLAPAHPYVQKEYMAIEDRTADPAKIIAKREGLLQRRPDDMDNRLRLAQLYVKTSQIDKAEAMLRAIWEDPRSDKIVAGRIMVQFYGAGGRYADGMKVLNELLEKTDDKVAAYLVWGEFLDGYDFQQAENAYKKAIEAGRDDERGYLAMAKFMAGRNKWIEAADAMTKCIEISPAVPERKKDLIKYLVRGKQVERAEKLLEEVLRESPSDSQAIMLKALVAIQKGQVDQGEQLLSRAIEQDPKLMDAFYYRSQIYKASGRIDAARKDLEAARRLSNNPRISMDLAEVMLSQGDRTASQLIYKEILRERPGYKPAITKLLSAYLKQSRWAPMAELLSSSKARFPSDPTYHVYEAKMWRARQQTARQLDALRRSIQIAPNYLPALSMYLAELVNAKQYDQVAEAVRQYKDNKVLGPWVSTYQGWALAKQGKLEEADRILQAVLRQARGPQITLTVVQLTRAYGNAEAAKRLVAWIPAIGPENWQLQWELGEIYLGTGQNAKAVESFRAAQGLADTDDAKAQAKRGLAMTYYVTGKFNEAATTYLEVLKIRPEDPESLNDLACIYVDELDRPADAIPYARDAAAAKPTSGGVADTFGWALAKSGKLDQAVEQLGRSVQLSPAVPDNRYHLGWTYEQMGRLRDAERQYSQAFEMIRDKPDHHLQSVASPALQRVRQKMTAEE